MLQTKLYVVRHGETTYNRDGISSGHVNPQLTETGKAQAKTAQKALSKIRFDEVYSSDLDRAIETAKIIYGKPVPKTHRLEGLRERSFGIYDGKPYALIDDLHAAIKTEFDTWDNDKKFKHKYHPSMESNFELSERFIAALAMIAEQHPGKSVLVVAHGGALRTTLITLGYASLDELPPGAISNAAYVELDYQDGVFTTGEVVGVAKLTLEP